MSFVTISRGKAFVDAVLSLSAAEIAEREAEIARRVRQDVGRLRDRTEAEARAAGEAAARAALAPEQAALAAAASAFTQASAQLAAPLAQKEHEIAELVTELAFLLARHIIGAEASSNPASLQHLVTQLLAEAAAERGPRQTLLLRVNPADQAHLAAHIPAETASLLADANIAQGGALVEIITQDGDPIDKIEWDATLQGRLETIRQALALPPEVAP
jgi:flagellar assembly protein FliH